MGFAALEARVALACVTKLANAIVTWKGTSINAVFDRGVNAQLGIEAHEASLSVRRSDVPGLARGDAFVIDGTTYTHAAEIDGSDNAIVTCLLQRSA